MEVYPEKRIFKHKKMGIFLLRVKEYGKGVVVYHECDIEGNVLIEKRFWSNIPTHQARIVSNLDDLIELK